jgi:hypothetical protein
MVRLWSGLTLEIMTRGKRIRKNVTTVKIIDIADVAKAHPSIFRQMK